jgi:hypothetical protein
MKMNRLPKEQRKVLKRGDLVEQEAELMLKGLPNNLLVLQRMNLSDKASLRSMW